MSEKCKQHTVPPGTDICSVCGARVERHDVDAFGNVMPPGMFVRNGVYYVRAMRGERRKKSTGRKDYKGALRRYHEIMKDWNDGRSDARVPTLANYWKHDYRPAWTVGLKTPDADGSYRDDNIMVQVLRDLGEKKLTDITSSVAQKWAVRRRGMSYIRKKDGPLYQIAEGTVTRELGLLQAMFQQAINDGLIEKNPWKSVKREPHVVRDRVLSLTEQAQLLEVLPPRYARWMLFVLGTGLRLEEVRGISEATDLNFSESWVRVTRKTRGRTKKVQRVPIIDRSTLDVLQEQLTIEGQLWHVQPRRFRWVLATAAERLGIPHLSPHTLRHTFATRYLQGGGDIYVLSKILGHSSVTITERVYAHLVGDDLLQRSRGVNLGLSAGASQTKVVPFPRRAGGARAEEAS